MNAPRNPADSPRAKPGRRPTGADGISAADARAKRDDEGHEDDEDIWRHAPVAPVNEANPLRSLGKAVGEAVIGSDRDTATPRKR